MADDLKRLVEKYKRELMDFSKSSSSEKPPPLHFPEMTADPPRAGNADNNPTAQAAESPAIEPVTETAAADAPVKSALPTPENNANQTPSGSDDIRETRNPRSDIKPLETQTNGAREMQPEREYADIRDFYNINNRRGTLRFRVYTAREALPVSGALIEVTKVIGNDKHTFYKLTTDISGNTPIIYLPAPSSALSQDPENTTQPYALYDVYITADNFGDVSIKDLPIFDGILSEQSIAMTPNAAGGGSRQITENGPGVNGGVY